MGSFNSTGFLSRIPILYGDRVVCFLGKRNVGSLELGSPFALVSPVYLPFRGKYNDYGSIEEVDVSVISETFRLVTGSDVESFCRAVERCLYGDTINENIKYWKDSKEDKKMYKSLLSVYNENSLPVLLFEHEDFYDSLFSGEPKMKWYGQEETFYEGFEKLVEKTSEMLDIIGDDKDLLADIYPPMIFGGSGGEGTNFFSVWRSTEKGEKCFKIREEIKDLFNPAFPNFCSGPSAFQLYKFMEVRDIVALYMKSKDEVKKVFNMIASLLSIPMNIGFSKTCGEQSYSLKWIEKYHQSGLKIIEKKKLEDDCDCEEEEL